MTSEARRICDSLAPPGDGAADARTIADRSAQVWADIDTTLAPIIGSRGVAALYSRSLHVAGSSHPCLIGVTQTAGTSAYAPLVERLAMQTPALAHGAACALVQTFCDLLASLIGTSLTERLLSHVRDFPNTGHSTQDTPQ